MNGIIITKMGIKTIEIQNQYISDSDSIDLPLKSFILNETYPYQINKIDFTEKKFKKYQIVTCTYNIPNPPLRDLLYGIHFISTNKYDNLVDVLINICIEFIDKQIKEVNESELKELIEVILSHQDVSILVQNKTININWNSRNEFKNGGNILCK